MDLHEVADCARVVDGKDIILFCAAVTSGAPVTIKSLLAHVTPDVITDSASF